jgi:hypothetical protein
MGSIDVQRVRNSVSAVRDPYGVVAAARIRGIHCGTQLSHIADGGDGLCVSGGPASQGQQGCERNAPEEVARRRL